MVQCRPRLCFEQVFDLFDGQQGLDSSFYICLRTILMEKYPMCLHDLKMKISTVNCLTAYLKIIVIYLTNTNKSGTKKKCSWWPE